MDCATAPILLLWLVMKTPYVAQSNETPMLSCYPNGQLAFHRVRRKCNKRNRRTLGKKVAASPQVNWNVLRIKSRNSFLGNAATAASEVTCIWLQRKLYCDQSPTRTKVWGVCSSRQKKGRRTRPRTVTQSTHFLPDSWQEMSAACGGKPRRG